MFVEEKQKAKLEKEKKRQKDEDAISQYQYMRQQLQSSQSNNGPTSSSQSNRSATATSSTVPSTAEGASRVMSAAQRRAANKNHPTFKEHTRNTHNLKMTELQQDNEKKLHDQYLSSLDIVLKQKRAQEDRFMDQKMATVRGGSGRDGGGSTALAAAGSSDDVKSLRGDPLIRQQPRDTNRWNAYQRRPSNPSMFGRDHRRAYQLSVEQPNGKTHLNVFD